MKFQEHLDNMKEEKMDEALNPKQQIAVLLQKLERMQGYKEDNNSEFLGPWVAEVRKVLKKMK